MTSPDELERAVERLTAVSNVNGSCPGWSVTRQDDLRLILSERAELLATVERMRGATMHLIDALAHFRQARAALTTGEATTPNAGEGK